MPEQLTNSLYNPTAKLAFNIGSTDISLTYTNDVDEMPNSGEFRICAWDGQNDSTKEIIKVGVIDKSSKVLSSLTRAVEGPNPAQLHSANSFIDLILTKEALIQYINEHVAGTVGENGEVTFAIDDPGNSDFIVRFLGDQGYIQIRPHGTDLDLVGGPLDGTAINVSTVESSLLGITRIISDPIGIQQLTMHTFAGATAGMDLHAVGAADVMRLLFNTGGGLNIDASGNPIASFITLNDNGSPVFRIDSDGTVHIKAGTSIMADL